MRSNDNVNIREIRSAEQGEAGQKIDDILVSVLSVCHVQTCADDRLETVWTMG